MMVSITEGRRYYIDGLVQERRNSSALAMELRLYCSNHRYVILYSHQKKFSNTWWWNQLWIQKLQKYLKCRMYLKYAMHKPNIYTIWYIECTSIFDKIGMMKYPWKSFQWYRIPEGHNNWNKGQISKTLVRPQNFPSDSYHVMSNRWNKYNFSTLRRLHTWEHRGILVLLLIFVDWYKHSNTNVVGSKCILNRFWCIIWRPKTIFDQNAHISQWVT